MSHLRRRSTAKPSQVFVQGLVFCSDEGQSADLTYRSNTPALACLTGVVRERGLQMAGYRSQQGFPWPLTTVLQAFSCREQASDVPRRYETPEYHRHELDTMESVRPSPHLVDLRRLPMIDVLAHKDLVRRRLFSKANRWTRHCAAEHLMERELHRHGDRII